MIDWAAHVAQSLAAKLLAQGQLGIEHRLYAHVAQSVERVLGKDEVSGSIPLMGLRKRLGKNRRVKWPRKNLNAINRI